jgi:hypothetical protein
MSNHLHLIADRRSRTPGFAQRPDATGSGPLRAVLQRSSRPNWTPLAESFLCLYARAEPSLDCFGVERNPLRAKTVRRAEDYVWSSAIAHVTEGMAAVCWTCLVQHALFNMEWWRQARRTDWREVLNRKVGADEELSAQHELRACTFAERPFGDEVFIDEIAHSAGCHWKRGRSSKRSTLKPHERAAQFSLFRTPSS